MAATITTTGEITRPVNVAFTETFLRRAKQNLPYFMGTMPGQLNLHAGTSTVKWRRIEQETPSITPLAELTGNASFMMGRSADTPTFNDVTATVSKYGQFYILNEEVELFNPSRQGVELMNVMGEAAGRALNQLQRNLAEDNLTKVYVGNVASVGAVSDGITAGALKLAANTLLRNSARTFTPMTRGSQNVGTSPTLASFWAITHPDVASDVSGLTGFVSVEQYAGQVKTAPGEFGYFPGAGVGTRFLYSQDATIDAGAGASSSGALRETSGNSDIYTTVVYGRDALGSVGLGHSHTDSAYQAGDTKKDWEIIVHERGSSGVADPFSEVSTIAWKSWHAAAVLNPAWGRAIISGASEPSA